MGLSGCDPMKTLGSSITSPWLLSDHPLKPSSFMILCTPINQDLIRVLGCARRPLMVSVMQR